MEGRLRQAPLAQPERVLARQQSVADTVPETLVERALVVVAGIVLKDMLDVRRIGQQKSMVRTGLQMHEVAVSIRRVEEGADGVRAEVREHSEDRIPARSGRKPG